MIDTGLVSHPDLVGQTVPGYDMISDEDVSNDGDGRDADPSDPGDWCGVHGSSWHGTHVAGTIAALANNSLGVFGGAPGVRIEPVRALGTCGGYSSDIADGIRWAAGGTVPGVAANPNPARVLNLSLSGSSPTCPPEFSSAIADARSRGAIVVVAAGNSSADSANYTPANCLDAVTVAAIDVNGIRASFSNYGPNVDIAGPGVGIWSTVDSGETVPAGSTYAPYNGTSMAAPHVALSAALVAAAYPDLTPDGIALALRQSALAFPADASGTGCPSRGCGAGIATAAGTLADLAAGPTAPGAPTGVGATPAGTTAVVGWTAPASNGGSSVTGYTVTSSPAGKTCSWTSGPLSCVIGGLADGLYTFTVRATNVAGPGPASGASAQIRIDSTAPTVTAPVATPVVGSTVTSVAAVRLDWTGADSGAGIASYEVSLSTNGGAYAVVATTTSTTTARSLSVSTSTTYRFRVRALDKAGNASGYATGATFHVKRVQQANAAVHYSGSWSLGTSSSASGGSYRHTSTCGPVGLVHVHRPSDRGHGLQERRAWLRQGLPRRRVQGDDQRARDVHRLAARRLRPCGVPRDPHHQAGLLGHRRSSQDRSRRVPRHLLGADRLDPPGPSRYDPPACRVHRLYALISGAAELPTRGCPGDQGGGRPPGSGRSRGRGAVRQSPRSRAGARA